MGKSCFYNLIAFYNEITLLMDIRKELDIILLDFSKDFDIFSIIILIDKLSVN